MKKWKLFVAICALPSLTFAKTLTIDYVSTGNFVQNEVSSAIGWLTEQTGDPDYLFIAEPGQSASGNFRMYFNFIQLDGFRVCKDEYLGKSIVTINEQDVEMSRFCVDSPNNVHTSMTATSERGNQYILDQFQNKNTVRFHFGSHHVTFDAKGYVSRFGKTRTVL